MHISNFISFFVGIWLSFSVSASNIDVSVDRTKVPLGHAITLRIQLKDDVARHPLSLNDLKKSFKVLNTYKSQRVSVTNGQREDVTEWTLSLMPKQEGRVVIPKIKAGSYQSRQISIEVLPATSDQGTGPVPVFFELDVATIPVLVQSQVNCRVKLFYLGQQLIDGQLTPIQAPDALMKDLGESRYREERDGYVYDVLERNYALFPQKVGFVEISGPTLEGALQHDNRGRGHDPWQGAFNVSIMQQGKPIHLSAGKRVLEVKAAPEHQGAWLPAQGVTLTSSWDKALDDVQVGQPITRTITMRVQGLMAEQLPEIKSTLNGDVQVYQDKPKVKTETMGKNVIGMLEQIITYIPTQAGSMDIPEIRIPWWNIKTKTQEMVTLKAVELEVQASKDKVVHDEIQSAAKPSLKEDLISKQNDPWRWLALLGIVLWLLTVLVWWRQSHRKKHPKLKTKVESTRKDVRAVLKHACDQLDPDGAKDALLNFAKERWPDKPPLSLGDLAVRAGDEDLDIALHALQKHLYASKSNTWDDAPALWHAFVNFCRKKDRTNQNTDPLPPLYPEP